VRYCGIAIRNRAILYVFPNSVRRILLNVPEDQESPCDERLRLSRAVVDAGNIVYMATMPDKLTARAAERIAIKALDAHRETHGC
jgi:tRNA G37 N-methylase Trm5